MASSIGSLNGNCQALLDPFGIGFLYTRPMELKDWVKASRAAAQLSQEQLGEAVGRGKATISQWEKGEYEPSYGQVLLIYERTFRKVALPNKTGAPPEVQAGVPSDLPKTVAELVRTVIVAAEKGVPDAGLNAVAQMLEVMANLVAIQTIDKTSTAEDTPTAGAIKNAIQTFVAPQDSGAKENARHSGKRREGN
jgi:DNA-binding XRE family transcriptional regulator